MTPDEFAGLYERHRSGVHRYLRWHLYDQEMARDLTSETFARALRSPGAFANEHYESAWLIRIAHRLMLDYWKSSRCRLELVWPDLQYQGSVADCADDAVALVEAEWVRGLVDQLPGDWREVIVLRYLQELSVAETAEVLECTVAACKQRTCRAMGALRRMALVADGTEQAA